MGELAKTAKTTKNTTKSKPVVTKDTPSIEQEENAIHPELYRYFGIDSIEDNRNNSKLLFLNSWAFEDGSVSVEKALQKMRKLEIKLGAPRVDETRIDKMFNWLRLLTTIKEAEKEEKKEIQDKDNIESEIERLQNQIKELESYYKGAVKDYKLNVTSRAKSLRDNYAKELKGLKERHAEVNNEYRG